MLNLITTVVLIIIALGIKDYFEDKKKYRKAATEFVNKKLIEEGDSARTYSEEEIEFLIQGQIKAIKDLEKFKRENR